MDQRSSSSNTANNSNNLIRFSNDSDFTFVNYDIDNENRFAYQRQARLHNAHRRRTRATQTVPSATVQAHQLRNQSVIHESQSLLDPVSSYARDPFSSGTLMPTRQLETVWRMVFPHYFYLPLLSSSHDGLQVPSDAFLHAAKASSDIYRSIVVQAVLTNLARNNNGQADEAVFRNQALILRDFRHMVDHYNTPVMELTSQQFQHVFASAFSLSGHGFNKEAGYNAIITVNSMMMSACHNRTVTQTAVSEWLRMLMPQPGPSFERTPAYKAEMLRKVNLVLDFLDRVQSSLPERFSEQVAQLLQSDTAIRRLVTIRLPESITIRPYEGFHAICLHRILSLLHRYFDHVSRSPSIRNLRLLQTFESRAAACLKYPASECVTLFLWCLIADTVGTELNEDKDEPMFSWAMKDLLSIHNITFKDELTAWLFHKASPEVYPNVPVIDIDAMRETTSAYYTQI